MIRLICLMCCALFVMNSCTSKDNRITKDEVNEIVYDYVYPIPTSYHLTEMLNDMGAEYIVSLCNDVARYDKYVSTSLGIWKYVPKYIGKHIGENYDDVYHKFCQMFSIHSRRGINVWRYSFDEMNGDFFIDENKNIQIREG